MASRKSSIVLVLIVLANLTVLILAGLALYNCGCFQKLGSLTAPGAVRNMVLEREPIVLAFKVSEERRNPEGTVTIVYTFQRPASPDGDEATYMLLHANVKQQPWPLWRVMDVSGGGSNTASLKGELVDFTLTQREYTAPTGYTALYGRILSEKVSAVTAVQNDGGIVRDEADDGFFALFSARGTIFCQLQAVDQNNEVLKRIDIEDPLLIDNPQLEDRCSRTALD